MDPLFFPNLPFAIAFAAILLAGLGWIARVDLQVMVIPKRVVLPVLVTGVVMNVARGGWLAAGGHRVWAVPPDNVFLGTLDGFLFALAGFACGFLFFFLLWIFSVAGGGDVKLVAAVGAWLGPAYVFGAIFFSVMFLLLLAVAAIGYRMVRGKMPTPAPSAPLPGRPTVRRRTTSYALAFCLGAGVIVGLLVQAFLCSQNPTTAVDGVFRSSPPISGVALESGSWLARADQPPVPLGEDYPNRALHPTNFRNPTG